ncbi:MAG: hypothetical protein MJZ65_04730 [Paludibacteraceae bacterium]|nr:hypothetical protein [Paludibacteraceae bacterium]
MKRKSIFLLLLLTGVTTISAQGNQFRILAGANALSLDCVQTDWMVNYERTFTYNLGVGLQAGFHSGIKPERWGALDTDYSCFKHQWTTDIYGSWKPINNQHVVTLGIGYSFTLFTSNDVQATNHDFAFRRQTDHGILGRVSYEYVFKDGFSLGAFGQYTNYFLHSSTQDQFIVGITVGFRF